MSVVLALSSFSPTVLSTTGGGTFTILGAGFGSDTVVTFGSLVVTGVTITPTSLILTAPAHAPGVGSFTVTSGGKSVSGSATFVAPSGLNLAPTISNLRTVGSRANQPSLFVDLSEEVQLLATVSNAETGAALSYAWTVSAGTVSGTGSTAIWKLPSILATTPAPLAVTLTVTETYSEAGLQHRNVSTASTLANAHDSQSEILNKGFQFLDRFSQSSVPLDFVIAEFSPTCDDGVGRRDEAHDVDENRRNYLELPGYTVRTLPPATFNFGGRCPFRSRKADACARFDTRWFVRFLIDVYEENGTFVGPKNSTAVSAGVDFVTAVAEGGQWKLCHSDWQGESQVTWPDGTVHSVKVLPGLGGPRAPAIKKQQP